MSSSNDWCVWSIQVVAHLSTIYPKYAEAPAAGLDEMTKLAYLHQPGVLQNVFAKFNINEIYVRGPAYYDALRYYSQFISSKLRN